MTDTATPDPRRRLLFTALFLAFAMAATVGTALGFQYIGGYIPCKLCYEQRMPYYIGVPLMLLGALAAFLKLPLWIVKVLLGAGGVLMAYGFFLGGYHAGVEWGWWPGPSDCTNIAAPVDTGGNGVLDALDQFVPPSCDKAALRIFGLSMAGWNVIASLILAVVAFRAAFSRGR